MGRIVRAAAAALVTVGLAGCWPAPGQGPDRRAHNPFEAGITTATAADLVRLWDGTIPGTGPGAGTPVVSAHGVHVGDGGAIYTFDRGTGAFAWQYHPVGIVSGAVADPFVDGDRVLYSGGTTAGEAGAWTETATWVDARDGHELSYPATGPATALRGTLVASRRRQGGGSDGGPADASLRVIDLADPSAGWEGTIAYPALRDAQPATLGAERLYHAGVVDTSFTADAPVSGVRAYPLATPATCEEPPEQPAPPGGALAPIPCPAWQLPTASPPVAPVVVGAGEDVVHAVLQDGTLLTVDAASGEERWRTDLGPRPSAAPALADGWLYVPLVDGDLAVVDAATGAVAWRADVGSAARQPAVAGRATPGGTGVVVVGTDAGDVVALPAAGCGAATCDALWSHDLGTRVTGAPAVSGGRLYVGTQSPARVVAFGLAPGGS